MPEVAPVVVHVPSREIPYLGPIYRWLGLHAFLLLQPFEVFIHLSARVGASAPLTAAGVSSTTKGVTEALWGPPEGRPPAVAAAAKAASAAATAAAEAAGPCAGDILGPSFGEPPVLPSVRGPRQWIRGAPSRVGALLRSAGKAATEILSDQIPFAAAALLQQLQQRAGGPQEGPSPQSFVRLDAKGALSLTPYAFLRRPRLKGPKRGPLRGPLPRLLGCLDWRGLCLHSALGAHLFVGAPLLQLVLQQAPNELLLAAAAAAAAEGPPGEVPTLEGQGAPRGLERFAAAAAALKEAHPMILSAEHSLSLPFVAR